MKSQARIEAGRRNGMLARGKKSEEARQKCSQNSAKHGLFSKTLVLANESPELFESTRKSYYDLWKPENEFEADLVNDMVAARWRLNRVMAVEHETLDLRQARMDHSGELKKEFDIIPEPVRLAIAYDKESNGSKTMANLSRYEARYFRQLRQAAAELRQVQKDRRAAEAEAAEEAITSEPEPICGNEGNASPKPAPKPLEIVRSEPKPAAQSDNSTKEDPHPTPNR
jgi:hypothetical protein